MVPATREVNGAIRTSSACALLLAFFALLLAILLASFTARNSDIWLHLATGRALVNGTYTFGTEPFTYTGGGVYCKIARRTSPARNRKSFCP